MHFVSIDMVYRRIPNAIEIVGGESKNGISREYRERAMFEEKFVEKLELSMCNIFWWWKIV